MAAGDRPSRPPSRSCPRPRKDTSSRFHFSPLMRTVDLSFSVSSAPRAVSLRLSRRPAVSSARGARPTAFEPGTAELRRRRERFDKTLSPFHFQLSLFQKTEGTSFWKREKENAEKRRTGSRKERGSGRGGTYRINVLVAGRCRHFYDFRL